MTQVGQVLRRRYLGQAENILKVTNAERRFRKQMDDTQPSLVAKAVVDLDQLRDFHIAIQNIP